MSAPALTVRAPGKLVLAGEYAVLDGAPALVMAVDHGVRCQFWPGDQGVRIETPTGDDRFVRPALQAAPAGHYRFSDLQPLDLPDKPGFGGSAAACVAACIAAGRPARDALEIHRRVQGGGSGIDVLASVHGGCIEVHGGHVQPREVAPPVVVYSGASARTGPRVQQYLAWSDRPARHAFVAESTALVRAFPADPVGSAAAALELLRGMARATGIDYLVPGLARVCALAREHGGAAKPSGAGGGDIAVAWLPDPDAQASFLRSCRGQGLPPIPVQPAAGAGRE